MRQAAGVFSIEQALLDGAGLLRSEDRRSEAELLLAHALGCDRGWLYAHAQDPLTPAICDTFFGLVARRGAGEPVAYLTGKCGFWTFDLRISPAVLIPRPETERLVEAALSRLPIERKLRVADLGTGSGAVALAVAVERPYAQVIATDVSADALALAQHNAATLGLTNIEFRHGDWWQPLMGERFDLIASNPPYVAEGDPHLQQGDLRYEPARALSSGADGLDAIRVIVSAAAGYLNSSGWLLLEHGREQAGAVGSLLDTAGFTSVETLHDLEGRERVTLGRAG